MPVSYTHLDVYKRQGNKRPSVGRHWYFARPSRLASQHGWQRGAICPVSYTHLCYMLLRMLHPNNRNYSWHPIGKEFEEIPISILYWNIIKTFVLGCSCHQRISCTCCFGGFRSFFPLSCQQAVSYTHLLCASSSIWRFLRSINERRCVRNRLMVTKIKEKTNNPPNK